MTKDLIKDFQDLIDSVKAIEKRPYSFGEIIKDFSGYQHRVMEKLYTRFNANPHGYCFPILVEDNQNELNIYTLIEVSMLDSYTQVIPENKFSYACDLKKMSQTDFKETVEIKTMDSALQVVVDLYKTTFLKSNVISVNFPEDYFLKGIPILTEQLSKQFVILDTDKKSYKNEHFSLIKKITEKTIVEKL